MASTCCRAIDDGRHPTKSRPDGHRGPRPRQLPGFGQGRTQGHTPSVIDDDPELKAEIKEAVSYCLKTKRSVYAELKASRAATRLGLRMLPDELQGEMEPPSSVCLRKLGTLLERAL